MSFSLRFNKEINPTDDVLTKEDIDFQGAIFIPKAVENLSTTDGVNYVFFFKVDKPKEKALDSILDEHATDGVVKWLAEASKYLDILFQDIDKDKLYDKEVLSNYLRTIVEVAMTTSPLSKLGEYFEEMETLLVDNDKEFQEFLKVHNFFALAFENYVLPELDRVEVQIKAPEDKQKEGE